MIQLTASLTEILAALKQRKVSAVELLDAHLARIAELDGFTNAVVTIAPDRAQREAAAIDDARTRGDALGPLAGVPITIKDALATEGIRSTGGAIELQDHVPAVDAAAVATVRAAGAVVFGKTNVPRWSGDYQTYNEMFGTTNNPWNLECTPGGSSGGPAAAVAMGFTGFEIGTDIGGSIRVPASFNGIFGHKPSFGIIPTHGYLDSVRFHRHVADVNVFGPMARSLDDLELLFGLLAGPNADDSVGWKLDLPPARGRELGDFRVVAWLDDEFCPVEPEVAAVLARAVLALEEAGARIDRDRRPQLNPLTASIDGSVLIGAATDIADNDAFEAATPAGPGGDGMSHRQWDVMDRERGVLGQRWAEFFSEVDVLLCPVTPTPAFKHVHSTEGSNWATAVLADHDNMPYRQQLRWNTLIGSAYLPVTTPPVGRTEAGLPVGMQVVAPHLHDHTALAFARCLGEVIGGYEAPPLAG